MSYNFVEWAKNINYYAIIDAVIILTIFILSIVFFAYKRNMAILIIMIMIMVLDIAVNVLSELYGGSVLVPAKYIMHFMMIFATVLPIVVYKADLKIIVQKISNPRGFSVGENASTDDDLRNATIDILTACQDMSKANTGAIILIDEKKEITDNIIETGTRLGATLSAPLLIAIFNTHAPLHDGAVIVRGNKIIAAGCFLTLTQRHVNKELGTRHRAAIGVTEEFKSVLSIVCSEETGIISIVKDGQIQRYMTMDKLKDEIETAYGIAPQAAQNVYRDKKYSKRFDQ
ncbi:MAG: DNA integrity scanning protein DisA nucleotide-binding domain protein [Clostridia bacterium]|nr:DNA integrity scanning protein DisA nucleotide-binding domain protein [Clostridia bacterium]